MCVWAALQIWRWDVGLSLECVNHYPPRGFTFLRANILLIRFTMQSTDTQPFKFQVISTTIQNIVYYLKKKCDCTVQW